MVQIQAGWDFPVSLRGRRTHVAGGEHVWFRLTEALSTAPCRCSRVAPHKRENCGFPGITSDQCFSSGCCFDSSVVGVPWCFHPLPKQGNPQGELALFRRPDRLPSVYVWTPARASQEGGERGPWPAVHTRSPQGQPLALLQTFVRTHQFHCVRRKNSSQGPPSCASTTSEGASKGNEGIS